MIRVGIADVTPLLSEDRYEVYYRKLPAWRREKADRMKRVEDRALSVGAWILWEELRRQYKVQEEVLYNLSHSGNYAMCAFSDEISEGLQVGCDVERIGKWRPELVRRFFCKTEQEYIENCKTEEEKRELFYRYWVWKESFMKATRMGMRLPLDAFEIIPNAKGVPELKKRPEEFGGLYCFQEYTLQDVPYKMAVCSNSMDISQELQVIHFS